MKTTPKAWLRFSLQAKLFSISFLFLLIPWLCFQYVLHMEEYLRAGQEQVVSGTAKAVATALHERDELFNPELNLLPNVQKGRDLHAIEVQEPIQLDGLLRDWKKFPGSSLAYAEALSESSSADELVPLLIAWCVTKIIFMRFLRCRMSLWFTVIKIHWLCIKMTVF